MGLISWHTCTTFYFFLIGCICKNTILDGEYSVVVSIGYYLALIWLVHKYYMSYEPSKVPDNDFSVCIIGAGFSGINMAIKLQQIGVKYRIIDKDDHLGGTWWQNQYPGCACDVYSHYYSLSFELNPDWSRVFSSQPEILRYLERVADKYGITEKIELGKSVTKMTWDEKKQQWSVTLSNGEVFHVNSVVCGVGSLNVPKIPEFKDRNLFKGEIFHTAEWKKDWNPKGRRVALIGTGATAVQVQPSIAPEVEHLHVFQRSSAWVFPKPDFAYPRWLRFLFRIYPPLMVLHRVAVFLMAEFLFHTVWKMDGILQTFMRKFLITSVNSVIKDPELAKKLTPDYEVGCKRIAPSNDYLPSFNRDNVTLVTDAIDRFTEHGIITKDGTNVKVDTIICATGFAPDKSFQTFKTLGLNPGTKEATDKTENGRRTLQEEWGDSPNAYLGITHPGYPNLFYLMGPGTLLGHSSVVFMAECSVDYTVDAIRYMIEKKVKSLDLKPEVNDEYRKWVKKTMQNKVFNSQACTSWYKNKDGVNYTLWPSHLPLYWSMTKNIDPEHYNMVS